MLPNNAAGPPFARQVVQQLHLQRLQVVADVLILCHLLLIHGVVTHHVPLLSDVVEHALQVLRQLHLTVNLIQLLLCCRLGLAVGSHCLVVLLVAAGLGARSSLPILLGQHLLAKHLH